MEPFLGEIKLVSFDFAPRGWALCAGQLLPIQQYTALFSLIGTFYGGDGVRTFQLPDLRGRAILHVGNGYVVGQQGGTESHTVNVNELPAHSHTRLATTAAADSSSPSGGVPAVAPTGLGFTYGAASSEVGMAPTGISATGGSQPHENRMPYLAMTYVIALSGIFPSRN